MAKKADTSAIDWLNAVLAGKIPVPIENQTGFNMVAEAQKKMQQKPVVKAKQSVVPKKIAPQIQKEPVTVIEGEIIPDRSTFPQVLPPATESATEQRHRIGLNRADEALLGSQEDLDAYAAKVAAMNAEQREKSNTYLDEIKSLAGSKLEYERPDYSSTNKMQLELQKQIEDLSKKPANVDTTTQLIAYLGPALMGALTGGYAGRMAAPGAFKFGQEMIEGEQKRVSDERKSRLESLGKQLTGVGDIRKGQAEQGKQAFEEAKSNRDFKAELIKYAEDKIADDLKQGRIQENEARDAFNELDKFRLTNVIPKGLENLTDIRLKEQELFQKKKDSLKQDKKDKRDLFKDTMSLRKEFQSRDIVREWNDIESAYNKLKQITPNQGSGAKDLAIIFSYMKLLDPRSVVREGEQERAIKTGGIPDRVWSWYQRIENGQLLPPNIRSEFKSAAGELVRGHAVKLKEVEDEFENIARDEGFDTKKIFLPKASRYLPRSIGEKANGGEQGQSRADKLKRLKELEGK